MEVRQAMDQDPYQRSAYINRVHLKLSVAEARRIATALIVSDKLYNSRMANAILQCLDTDLPQRVESGDELPR